MSDFVLTGEWTKLQYRLNPGKFTAKMRAIVGAATKLNGMYVAGQIKRGISQGGFEENSNLTAIIKRSTKPLSDTGALYQAITSSGGGSWKAVFVGVKRSSKTKDGRSLVNIALALHEGASIKVSTKMRTMFWYLWQATSGKMPGSKLTGRAREIFERVGTKQVIKPLRPSTTAIRIPARPFIRRVFEDPKVHAVVKQNWAMAVDKALRA